MKLNLAIFLFVVGCGDKAASTGTRSFRSPPPWGTGTTSGSTTSTTTPTGTTSTTSTATWPTCPTAGPPTALPVPSLPPWGAVELSAPDFQFSTWSSSTSTALYLSSARGMGLADDGSVCVGANGGFGYDGEAAYLARIDPLGSPAWTVDAGIGLTYGASGTTGGGCFAHLGPGGYSGYYLGHSLVRFDASGSVDPTFALDSNLLGDVLVAFAPTADGGAVLLVGDANGGRVLRVDASGCMDAGFGVNGQVLLPTNVDCYITSWCDRGEIAILDDNSLMVWFAGELMHIDAVGAIDPSYGNGGVAVATGAFNAPAARFAPDGSVLIVGTSGDRAWAEGLDAAGIQDLAPVELASTEPIEGLDILADPAGNLLIAGRHEPVSSSTGQPVVARTDATGALDPGFGTGGLLTWSPLTSSVADFQYLELTPDDTLVMAGFHGGLGVVIVQTVANP